jgi:hypothetical protein
MLLRIGRQEGHRGRPVIRAGCRVARALRPRRRPRAVSAALNERAPHTPDTPGRPASSVPHDVQGVDVTRRRPAAPDAIRSVDLHGRRTRHLPGLPHADEDDERADQAGGNDPITTRTGSAAISPERQQA